MSRIASTPKMRATGSVGKPNVESVPIRITKLARGTAATPLLVNINVSIIMICWPIPNSIPAACATKIDAAAKYKVDPSKFKL